MSIISSSKWTITGTWDITLPSSLVEWNMILCIMTPYWTVNTYSDVTVNTALWSKVSSSEYSFVYPTWLGTVYFTKVHVIYKKYVSWDSLNITTNWSSAYIVYQLDQAADILSDYISFVTWSWQPNWPSSSTPYIKNNWVSAWMVFWVGSFSITSPPSWYSWEDIQNNVRCSCIASYRNENSKIQDPWAWEINTTPSQYLMATIWIPVPRVDTDWSSQIRWWQEVSLAWWDTEDDLIARGDIEWDNIWVQLPDDWDWRTKPTSSRAPRAPI